MSKTAVKKAKSAGKVKVTQVKSVIGRHQVQKDTLVGLGLNKVNRSKTLEDSPEVRGMINRVKHLVSVEDAA